MIEIAIDEKACVNCTLCAEVCPTEVFTFNEEKGIPEVKKAKQTFGCLSCSQICPADAIAHKGADLAASFYHDPAALKLASRLACDVSGRINVPQDAESKKKALSDLGLRLLSVAEVFKRTIGGSLPAVGTMAGRTLARHLPRYRKPDTLDEAIALTVKQFAPAWVMEPVVEGEELTITVKDCFVRDVCQGRNIELGGELCVLFYNYLAGYVGKMGGARLRLSNAERGSVCKYSVKLYR